MPTGDRFADRGRHQGLPFRFQPGGGVVRAGERRHWRRRFGHRRSHVSFGRRELVHRAGAHEQLLGAEPGQPGLPLELRVADGQLRRVGAQQVVHTVPVGPRLMDQVRPSERPQPATRGRKVGPGQRRQRVPVEVVSREHPAPPERLRQLRTQVPVRPGEPHPDRGGRFPGRVQQVESLAVVGQLGGECGQTRLGAGLAQLGHQPQRQRQPGTVVGQGNSRRRLPGHPLSQQQAQQVERLRLGERPECDPPRPLSGDQPGQRVPAGHHGEAATPGRQQRPDLRGVPGVVEHYQGPPVGEDGAVAGDPFVHGGWNVRTCHAQAPQQSGQRFGRPHRLVRMVAAQVQIEASVREPGGHPMCPVDGQGGLAHTRRTGDHRYRRLPRTATATAAYGVQLGQRVRAADEPGHARRQLPRHRRGPATAASPLLHPVPGRRQRPLFGRPTTEQPDQHIQPVGRRQCTAAEVLRDRTTGVSGAVSQFPYGRLRQALPAGALAPQQAHKASELVNGLHPLRGLNQRGASRIRITPGHTGSHAAGLPHRHLPAGPPAYRRPTQDPPRGPRPQYPAMAAGSWIWPEPPRAPGSASPTPQPRRGGPVSRRP